MLVLESFPLGLRTAIVSVLIHNGQKSALRTLNSALVYGSLLLGIRLCLGLSRLEEFLKLSREVIALINRLMGRKPASERQ